MSVWFWMLLLFLLPVAGSFDVENWLTPIVEKIRTEYKESEQFCVAVSIPVIQDPKQTLEVLQNNPYETVKNYISNVYNGNGVVAAKPSMYEHAEVRVLNIVKYWDKDQTSQDNFLVFYTFLSPCATQCANPDDTDRNILEDIKEFIFPSWGERHALVFGKPCTYLDGCDITREDLKKSFIHLYESGFKNIFRCYYVKTEAGQYRYRCLRCYSGEGEVVSECLEGAEPEQGGSAGSSQGASAGGKRGPAEGVSRSAAAKKHRSKSPE